MVIDVVISMSSYHGDVGKVKGEINLSSSMFSFIAYLAERSELEAHGTIIHMTI